MRRGYDLGSGFFSILDTGEVNNPSSTFENWQFTNWQFTERFGQVASVKLGEYDLYKAYEQYVFSFSH